MTLCLFVLLLFSSQQINAQIRYIEVFAKKQQMVDKGQGEPSVVLISGLGSDLKYFYQLQLKISDFTRVISYDRAGLGKSERISSPRSIDNLAIELHELLKNAENKPPYVLIGHSFGGYIVRMFCHLYPDDVAGLLLLDPSHELYNTAIKNNSEKEALPTTANISEQEFNQIGIADIELLKSAPIPKNVPVTIITSIRYADEEKKAGLQKKDIDRWLSLHQDLISDHPNAKHIQTNESGHVIHLDEPELVIEEIKQLLNFIKKQLNK